VAGVCGRCFGAEVDGGVRSLLPRLRRFCEAVSSPPFESPDAPVELPLRSGFSPASSIFTLGGALIALVPAGCEEDGPGTDRGVGKGAGGSNRIAETDGPRPGPCSTEGAGELASDRLVLHRTLLLLFTPATPGPVTNDALDPTLPLKLIRSNGETLRCCLVISGEDSMPEEPLVVGPDLPGATTGALEAGGNVYESGAVG